MRYGEGKVAIVGAGLAGSLMAVYLGRSGYRVDLFEKRPDPRIEKGQRTRSINLAISARGLDALGRVGLDREVLDMAIPMRGRMMHAQSGRLTFQPYGVKGQAINSVSRANLNLVMIEAADELSNVCCHFSAVLADADIDNGVLKIRDPGGGSISETYDAVIGADGAFSSVRAHMVQRQRFSFSQTYLEHGYKELMIPAGPNNSHRLSKHALHIWPRGGYMMIALPNIDGSFTCTLFWPHEGPNSFEEVSENEVVQFFESNFLDVVSLMPSLMEDFASNPTSSLATIRCDPWHVGKAVLLGDAAHAVVPFYGQGANAAFESCVVLDECLKECSGDWRSAFATYSQRRKPHTDALADLAIGNFVEMRNRVTSPMFLLKKKTEKLLLRTVPGYLPLYSMISFSTIPYAEAVHRNSRRNALTRNVVLLAGFAIVVLLLSYLLG